MNKKRIWALQLQLLTLVLVLSGCIPASLLSQYPETDMMPEEVHFERTPAIISSEETSVDEKNLKQLIVGISTEPTGDFATPYWQNNATDNLINSLLTGYSTYDISRTGEYVLNTTAVEKVVIIENDDGSKTYRFTLKEGLTYNDGTPIAAKDYVATALLWSSNQIATFGGKPDAGMRLVGFEDFRDGKTNVFRGVRLLDEMVFSFTIANEFVPYFYELADVSFAPTSLEFWLGEGMADVADDGEGAYFTGEFAELRAPGEGDDPSSEAFQRFNELKGYVLKQRNVTPRVTSGPYQAVSFDAATKTTVITLNDKFLGNFEGQRGSIQDLVFKKVEDDTQFDELRTGTVDLLSNLGGGDEINAGMDVVEEDEVKIDFISYPRAGYGKLMFICDFGPTQFVEVRQAVAHLLDRDDFAATFTGGYGSVVNGPYGEGQWLYKESKAELDSKLNNYSYSFDTAITLLEQAGFTKNADGSEYNGSGLRYREMDDGTLMPLILNWLSTEKNPVSDLLVTKLQNSEDVAKAGIRIVQDQVDFTELLNWMYRDTSQGEQYGVPTYHMMNLATNFSFSYTPAYEWTLDDNLIAQGYNPNRLKDQQLYELSRNYSLVDPTDAEAFRRGWVEYIVRWNELLPEVPLYSSEYHSFFNAKLKNLVVDDTLGLEIALLYATLE